MEQLHYNLIVIGGGAAGLMAAGQAAASGIHVLLLEKMEKPARKLRITGKGRCNLTNTKAWDEFSTHIYPDARFFKAAFYNFSNTAVIDFFERNGLPLVTEHGDRVYPASQNAWDVAATLVQWARQQGVEIRCHAEVLQLKRRGNCIDAVEIRQDGKIIAISADAFIVATGGLSYPATGSTGDGLRFAAETGHTITNLHPSLAGMDIEKHHPSLNGLALKNIKLGLMVDGSVVSEEFGELAFNETGIEGPVMLRLSRRAISSFLQGKKVVLVINLKPAVHTIQLRQRIFKEIDVAKQHNATVEALLRKLMPARLISAFAEAAGIAINRQIIELKQGAVDKLLYFLQCWKMPVVAVQGYERAVVTAGGVDLHDIDHKTMRSRKISNLFFAGEVINLDGDTGGYNLQISFSTGYLAGNAAAKLHHN